MSNLRQNNRCSGPESNPTPPQRRSVIAWANLIGGLIMGDVTVINVRYRRALLIKNCVAKTRGSGSIAPFLTSVLEGDEWSALHPSRRFPLDRRLGRPHSRFEHYEEEKNLTPAENRTLIVKHVACRLAN
jgi:hypothetical protein